MRRRRNDKKEKEMRKGETMRKRRSDEKEELRGERR